MGTTKRIVIILLISLTPWSEAYAFNLGKDVGNCFQGGCDVVWSLNQRIDQGIQSEANSLIGPARDAFIAAMADLFDNRLSPFLGRVNDDLSARIGQVGDRADKIVSETTDGLLKIIDAAGDLADRTSGDFQKIILSATREAANLEDKVNRDIAALVDDIDCKVNGTFEGLVDYFRQLATIPHPADACYRALGYFLTRPDSTDTTNWYRITKCVYMRDLDNSSTVSDIKFNYTRLSQLARRYRCIAQDPLATQLANADTKVYVTKFEMWFLASR